MIFLGTISILFILKKKQQPADSEKMYTPNKKTATRARANQVNLILNEAFTMDCSQQKKNTRQIRYDGVQFENTLDIFPFYMAVSVTLFETEKTETNLERNTTFNLHHSTNFFLIKQTVDVLFVNGNGNGIFRVNGFSLAKFGADFIVSIPTLKRLFRISLHKDKSLTVC